MCEQNIKNIDIDEKIIDVKVKLDYILNKFTNDDFEYFEPYPFIYGGEIKFVPVELKAKVTELFNLLIQLEQKNDKPMIKIK